MSYRACSWWMAPRRLPSTIASYSWISTQRELSAVTVHRHTERQTDNDTHRVSQTQTGWLSYRLRQIQIFTCVKLIKTASMSKSEMYCIPIFKNPAGAGLTFPTSTRDMAGARYWRTLLTVLHNHRFSIIYGKLQNINLNAGLNILTKNTNLITSML